jgi:hypothetical protein
MGNHRVHIQFAKLADIKKPVNPHLWGFFIFVLKILLFFLESLTLNNDPNYKDVMNHIPKNPVFVNKNSNFAFRSKTKQNEY